MVKLGDVCTIVSGTTPKSNCPEYWDGNINWVTPAELNDDSDVIYESQRKITEQAVQDSSLKPFPAGTVLLSSRAPIGKVAIAGVEMYCNQGFKNLICSDKIYNRYLYHFLKTSTEYLNSLGRGATFKEISKSIVENIAIPLPSLAEQRRIAAVMDKVSGLIAKRREQLDKLDELVKARFVEMFGDPVSNLKGWERKTIRDVVSEVKYGTSRPAVDGGAYKYLRMGNITFDGHLDLSDLKYIDIPDSELEKCLVRKGDVLFNRTNSKELVGKTCVFDLDEPMVIAGYIIRVRVNKKVLPIYLSAVLNSRYGKQTLADMCKAIVGQANINAQELQDIAILIPPIELQEKFSDYAETIKKSKLTIQQSLDKLKVLQKALRQQYFGG